MLHADLVAVPGPEVNAVRAFHHAVSSTTAVARWPQACEVLFLVDTVSCMWVAGHVHQAFRTIWGHMSARLLVGITPYVCRYCAKALVIDQCLCVPALPPTDKPAMPGRELFNCEGCHDMSVPTTRSEPLPPAPIPAQGMF